MLALPYTSFLLAGTTMWWPHFEDTQKVGSFIENIVTVYICVRYVLPDLGQQQRLRLNSQCIACWGCRIQSSHLAIMWWISAWSRRDWIIIMMIMQSCAKQLQIVSWLIFCKNTKSSNTYLYFSFYRLLWDNTKNFDCVNTHIYYIQHSNQFYNWLEYLMYMRIPIQMRLLDYG